MCPAGIVQMVWTICPMGTGQWGARTEETLDVVQTFLLLCWLNSNKYWVRKNIDFLWLTAAGFYDRSDLDAENVGHHRLSLRPQRLRRWDCRYITGWVTRSRSLLARAVPNKSSSNFSFLFSTTGKVQIKVPVRWVEVPWNPVLGFRHGSKSLNLVRAVLFCRILVCDSEYIWPSYYNSSRSNVEWADDEIVASDLMVEARWSLRGCTAHWRRLPMRPTVKH